MVSFGPEPVRATVRPSAFAAYTLCMYTTCVNTWDERKRRRNLKDHGIDFADLEGFFDGDLLTREDSEKPMVKRVTKVLGCSTGCPCSSCGRRTMTEAR